MSYLRALVEAKENFIIIVDVNEVFKFKLRWRFVDRALLSFKIQWNTPNGSGIWTIKLPIFANLYDGYVLNLAPIALNGRRAEALIL